MDTFTVSLILFILCAVALLLYRPVRYAYHHYREHCRICRSLDRARERMEAQKGVLRHG